MHPETAEMAACRKCGTVFERKPYNRECMCLSCLRIKQRAWRKLRRSQGKRVVTGKMSTEYRRLQMRERMKDPEQHRKALIRRRTNRAIESGKLVRQPCEVCGAAKTDAHHDDYDKPFDVRWLCRPHHAEHHAKERAID